MYAHNSGAAGAVGIDLNDAVVTTSGAYANGVWGDVTHSHNEAALTVAVTGGAVTAEGVGAVGVGARHDGLGSVALTVGAGAEVRAPFSIGAEGRLGQHHGNPDGRLVVSHGGTIEARDAGILAWAAVRSGHTFGAGAQVADDAARTEPMVHVTSSGDVTVGEAATDAFIRAAIAGADGALSAGEKAVYAAIVAEDSEELGAALAALPGAGYDAAWRARANALLTNRGHEPTDVAEEILGLTRSGIRALALPLEIIVAWVQEGAEGTSTLSPAERTVLAAVLTGGDLEAALAALPGAGYDYDDNWKNEMREWAASYNAGDVLVEVTGGTIAAEGDGVDARYAMTHDRNGAIAVTVADGATVSGGRHGVHVGGAGLAAGNDDLRDQTVTVDGAVMGGSGAGIHLAGGGTVVVGRTGRVGATSGVGVLSEGAGDLVATVAGAVEGDVRAMGDDLTFASLAGSSVTGTVHDPAGPLTVHGSVGRLLYANGGTVTVAGTGRLAGVVVEGRREAVRSEAGDLNLDVAAKGMVGGDVRALGGGDLDATVSGAVEGGLRAMGGGALTVDVKEGGAVTGTVHDPAGPLTVRGSIGRLLYASGGTVTVAGTGRLTGVVVEGGGEAIRSEAGDLSLNVAAMGSVAGGVIAEGDGDLSALVAGTLTGDLVEEGAGDLNATISGTVKGNVFGQGTGKHTVTVSKGGTVTGAIHLSASVVTVTGGRVAAGDIGVLMEATEGVAEAAFSDGARVEASTALLIRSHFSDVAIEDSVIRGDISFSGGGRGTHRLGIGDGATIDGRIIFDAEPGGGGTGGGGGGGGGGNYEICLTDMERAVELWREGALPWDELCVDVDDAAEIVEIPEVVFGSDGAPSSSSILSAASIVPAQTGAGRVVAFHKTGAGTARLNEVTLPDSSIVLKEGGIELRGAVDLGPEGTVTVHDGARLTVLVGDVTENPDDHGRLTAGGGVTFQQAQDAGEPTIHMQVASEAAGKTAAIQTALEAGTVQPYAPRS